MDNTDSDGNIISKDACQDCSESGSIPETSIPEKGHELSADSKCDDVLGTGQGEVRPGQEQSAVTVWKWDREASAPEDNNLAGVLEDHDVDFFEGEFDLPWTSIFQIGSMRTKWYYRRKELEKCNGQPTSELLDVCRMFKMVEPTWKRVDEDYQKTYWCVFMYTIQIVGPHVKVFIFDLEKLLPFAIPARNKILLNDVWKNLPNVNAVKMLGFWPSNFDGYELPPLAPLRKLKKVEINDCSDSKMEVAKLIVGPLSLTMALVLEEVVLFQVIPFLGSMKVAFGGLTEMTLRMAGMCPWDEIKKVFLHTPNLKTFGFTDMAQRIPLNVGEKLNWIIDHTKVDTVSVDRSVRGVNVDSDDCVRELKMVRLQWSSIDADHMTVLMLFKKARALSIDLNGTQQDVDGLALVVKGILVNPNAIVSVRIWNDFY